MIICATRGGQGSWLAQEAAINYARANDINELVFLYIVDETTVKAAGPLGSAITTELTWIGRTLTELARARAAQMGISAKGAVLRGDVQQQISAYLRQINASVLFLGAPRGTTTNVFGDDKIEQLANEIEGATNVKVTVVRPEKIASQ